MNASSQILAVLVVIGFVVAPVGAAIVALVTPAARFRFAGRSKAAWVIGELCAVVVPPVALVAGLFFFVIVYPDLHRVRVPTETALASSTSQRRVHAPVAGSWADGRGPPRSVWA